MPIAIVSHAVVPIVTTLSVLSADKTRVVSIAMVIEHFLKTLGLTENEIRIYLYLLTHGESIAGVITKRLGIKRATVYQTLESLENKEFITSFAKNKVAHFDAVEPDDIVALCEHKVHQMQKLKEAASLLKKELQPLRDRRKMPRLEIRGKIKYYEGLEAIMDLINETLDEKSTEQLCFGLNTYHTDLAGDDWQQYTSKRVKRGMKVKSIQPDTENAVAYKARDPHELRTTRLVPRERFPGTSEINIIGDMIAMFTVRGEVPMGMKIYNRDLAQALRSLFQLAWERAKSYDDSRGSEKNS